MDSSHNISDLYELYLTCENESVTMSTYLSKSKVYSLRVILELDWVAQEWVNAEPLFHELLITPSVSLYNIDYIYAIRHAEYENI